MAVVYVHATRAREFLTHYTDWCRSQPKDGLIRVDAMPVEGPPIGEEKQFLQVPDEFLIFLRAEHFPFRLG
jgi:hypothetical protein